MDAVAKAMRRNKLQQFADPLDPLEIVEIERDDGTKRQIRCQLCGWPDTSSRSETARGLSWILHLVNRRTKSQLLIGWECAEDCENILREWDPRARVCGSNEVRRRQAVRKPLVKLWEIRLTNREFPSCPKAGAARDAWWTMVGWAQPAVYPDARRWEARKALETSLRGPLLTVSMFTALLDPARKDTGKRLRQGASSVTAGIEEPSPERGESP